MVLSEFGEQRPTVIPIAPREPIAIPISPEYYPLSPRQREVLALAAQGLSKPEIGQRIQRDEETIKNHVRIILQKLGDLHSIDDAVVRGFEMGELNIEAISEGLEPERIEILDPQRRRLFDEIVEDGAAKPYKQIAQSFGTTEQGIKWRASELFAELGVRNRTHALTLSLVNNFDQSVAQAMEKLSIVGFNALHLLGINPHMKEVEIANYLHVSISVVKHRLRDAYKVLGVANKGQAAQLALRLHQRKERERRLAEKPMAAILIHISQSAPESAVVQF